MEINPFEAQIVEMCRDAEFSTLGFYEPGVFHLEIATREDLGDASKLIANPTFLHEYVHFLQDTTTTHGLLNFIDYVQYLKNAIKKVSDDAAAEFDTPVEISNSFEYLTNQKLRKIYYGDQKCNARAVRYSEFEVEIVPMTTNGGDPIPVKKYKVKYYDDGACSNETCHFGAYHIKEYMAHAIQNQFAPNSTHDHIPYVLVELLVQKEYPPLAADSALIVALCDASLMHYHPAQLFFDALERMIASRWTPAGVDSVYDFVLNGIHLEWKGRTETFASLFANTAGLAIESFNDTLKDQHFKENVRWFKQVMGAAASLRGSYNGFLAKLVSSPGQYKSIFTSVFNGMGTPFMTNALYHGYFYPPSVLRAASIQPYYPWVFVAVSKTFKHKDNKGCLLRSFCGALPGRSITDHNCESSPWERVHLSEVCPYGLLWHTWGLTGKKPRPAAST